MTDSISYPAFYQPAEIRQLLGGISEPTLWRLRRDGGFPKPIRLTPGKVVYRADQVHAWMAARLAAERNAA